MQLKTKLLSAKRLVLSYLNLISFKTWKLLNLFNLREINSFYLKCFAVTPILKNIYEVELNSLE